MIHHPQKSIIGKYSKGELLTPLATLVSAHLEVCQTCSSHYSDMIHADALDFESSSIDFSNNTIDHAFGLVMNKIENPDIFHSADNESENIMLRVSGQVIPLPRSMNFLKDKQIPWKEFGQKNAIAPILTGAEGNLYLIYMGPGETVPKHNHEGMEYSYVVAGTYDDGISSFTTGDFGFFTQTTTHSPRATSDDGCLVISWVEGRLNYFDGWLKPLNSILWWYLHRA